MQPREILISLAIKFSGDWNLIYQSLIRKENYEDEQEVLDNCRNLKCQAVTIMDQEYPAQLKRVQRPPFVLFYYGDISIIQNTRDCIGVIGSRHPTRYGISNTQKLVSNLPKQAVVVSGMAIGIDSVAHKSALSSGHKTVAVLGSGIDVCYPTSNQDLYDDISQSNLVLSEYPPGTPPCIPFFPARNRIIAGLSNSLLVTQATVKSGTMITVEVALQLGLDVMCLPSSDLGNSGTNYCIKQGAFIVETFDDVNYFFAKQNYYGN